MTRLSGFIVCIALLASACTVAQEAPEGRLLRFPDIHGDNVAFVYGGDIWLVSATGGAARRITADAGRELFPKFSPDGKWIAFTGQYDGNFNVYVMPADGGQPRQLTFYQGAQRPLSDRMGILNEVVAWTPDSKRIVFLSRRDSPNVWTKRLYTVSIDGGQPEPLLWTRAGWLHSTPTAPRSPITASSATSAPGSATPAGSRRTFTSTT